MGSWVLEVVVGIARTIPVGVPAGWTAAEPTRGEALFPAAPRTLRRLPRLAMGRPGFEIFRGAFGDVAFRAEAVIAGRLDADGFLAAEAWAGFSVGVTGFARTCRVAGVALPALVRDTADRAVGVCMDGLAWGAVGFRGVLGPGAGVTRARKPEGLEDGFPEDWVVLDREERGFWGISGELGIRQAYRLGIRQGQSVPAFVIRANGFAESPRVGSDG